MGTGKKTILVMIPAECDKSMAFGATQRVAIVAIRVAIRTAVRVGQLAPEERSAFP